MMKLLAEVTMEPDDTLAPLAFSVLAVIAFIAIFTNLFDSKKGK